MIVKNDNIMHKLKYKKYKDKKQEKLAKNQCKLKTVWIQVIQSKKLKTTLVPRKFAHFLCVTCFCMTVSVLRYISIIWCRENFDGLDLRTNLPIFWVVEPDYSPNNSSYNHQHFP